MTTGDVVRERALALAYSETDRDQAVFRVLTTCGGRRVAAVRARQQLLASLDSEPDQREAMRAEPSSSLTSCSRRCQPRGKRFTSVPHCMVDPYRREG